MISSLPGQSMQCAAGTDTEEKKSSLFTYKQFTLPIKTYAKHAGTYKFPAHLQLIIMLH